MTGSRLSLVLVAWAALPSGAARAGDTAMAEELFRQGKALMRAGDYAQACPKLAESFRQDPATGTLLALAVCQEESGQIASAWASYKDVVARAHQEGRADRERAARERAQALEPRLSTLQVDVPDDVGRLPGLLVTRDGVALPPAAWGSALPTDPGNHVVEAKATGRVTWRQSVVLGREADRKVVKVGTLEPEKGLAMSEGLMTPAAGPTLLSRPVGGSTAESPSGSPTAGGAAFRLWGLAATGVGVLVMGAGTAYALQAKDLDDRSKEDGQCTEEGCTEAGNVLNDEAVAKGNRATVLFIAGSALVAGGLTSYLFGRARSRSVEVAPTVGAGTGGAVVMGRF